MGSAWARALPRGGRQVPSLSLRRPAAGGGPVWPGGGSGGGGDAGGDPRGDPRGDPGGDDGDPRGHRGDPGSGGSDTRSGDPGDPGDPRGDPRGDPGGDPRGDPRGDPGGDPGGDPDPLAALEAALAALEAPGGVPGGRGPPPAAVTRAVTVTLAAAGAAPPARRRRLCHRLLRLLRPPRPPGPPPRRPAPPPRAPPPPHLESGLRILEHMEAHGLVPDEETLALLEGAFGARSRPLRKGQRMRYWLPRFRHADPHGEPHGEPHGAEPHGEPHGAEPHGGDVAGAVERARRGLRRMAGDPGTDVTVLQMPVTTTLSSGEEETLPFIVGSQSAAQRRLLPLVAARGRPLLVEGPLPLWLRGRRLGYYVLRGGEPGEPPPAEPPLDPERSFYFPLQLELELERGPWDDEDFDVDEVAEGPVLALCVPGDGARATLARWLSLLQATNPALGGVPVLFRLGGAAPPAADIPPLAAVAPPAAAEPPPGDAPPGDTPLGTGDPPRGDAPPGDTPRRDDDDETPWVRGQG